MIFNIPVELIDNIVMYQVPTYNYMDELKSTIEYSLECISEYIVYEFRNRKEFLDFCINEFDDNIDEYCYNMFIFYIFIKLDRR